MLRRWSTNLDWSLVSFRVLTSIQSQVESQSARQLRLGRQAVSTGSPRMLINLSGQFGTKYLNYFVGSSILIAWSHRPSSRSLARIFCRIAIVQGRMANSVAIWWISGISINETSSALQFASRKVKYECILTHFRCSSGTRTRMRMSCFCRGAPRSIGLRQCLVALFVLRPCYCGPAGWFVGTIPPIEIFLIGRLVWGFA